jgi:hypothetical protein
MTYEMFVKLTPAQREQLRLNVLRLEAKGPTAQTKLVRSHFVRYDAEWRAKSEASATALLDYARATHPEFYAYAASKFK